jgi:hypothetical protein
MMSGNDPKNTADDQPFIKSAGVVRAIMGKRKGPTLEERAHMLSGAALDPLNRLVHGEQAKGGLRGASAKAKEVLHGKKRRGLAGLAQDVKGQAQRATHGLLYGTETRGAVESAKDKRKALNVAAGPLGKPLSHYVGEEKKEKQSGGKRRLPRPNGEDDRD